MLAKSLSSVFGTEQIRMFLSYAHSDWQWLQELVQYLDASGSEIQIRLLCDQAQLQVGRKWGPQIVEFLRACDLVIVFISDHYLNSPECDHELRVAMEERKPLFPILLSPTSTPWQRLPLFQDEKLHAVTWYGRPLSEVSRKEAIEQIASKLTEAVQTYGLDPDALWRWRLRFEGDLRDFDSEKKSQVVESLRKVANDPNIRLVNIAPGSVEMTLMSRRATMLVLRQKYAEGMLRRILGLLILEFVELFGATVQSSSTLGDASVEDLSESLLLPGRKTILPAAKGLVIPRENATNLHFVIDSGDQHPSPLEMAVHSRQAIEYFREALLVNQDKLIVDFAPDRAQVLPAVLIKTRLGRTLVEFDLRLKRMAASLQHPDSQCGKQYWNRVFRETTNALRRTDVQFTNSVRVWLKPEKILIYANELTADVQDALPILRAHTIGDMIGMVVEQNFLLVQEEVRLGDRDPDSAIVSRICHDAFQELLLPVLQHEWDSGAIFATMRQACFSIILATWAKGQLRDNPRVGAKIDQDDLATFELPTHGVFANIAVGRDVSQEIKEGVRRATRRHRGEACRRRHHGESRRALTELEQLFAQVQDVCGDLDVETAQCRIELGRALQLHDRHGEAVCLIRDALMSYVLMYGLDHRDTWDLMDLLGQALVLDDRIEEGQEWLERACFYRECGPLTSEEEHQYYFSRYLQLYEHGVFRATRSTFDPSTAQHAVRNYFSGAADLRLASVIGCASNLWVG